MGDWKTAPIAQAVFDKKQTDAIDSMYDKESETKIVLVVTNLTNLQIR